MAQNDMNIANQGFPGFRADLNDALGALVSNSSGATAPATTFAHQFWVDTSANPSILKVRNADNDAFITIGEIDQTGDKFNLKCANATILENLTVNAQGDVRFADSDSSHFIAFQAPATVTSNVTFTLPAADGTNGQVIQTNGSGTLSFATAGGALTGATDSGTPFETSLGTGAGAVTTGVNNTFVGFEAGNDNTTGTDNTAVGFKALDVSTTGCFNTAVGVNALGANTSGSFNTAVANNALLSNTTGNANTAVGRGAMLLNTTGCENTAVGRGAMLLNTTGIFNVATGAASLFSNTTGDCNSAYGVDSLTSNTTGCNNTALGENAMRANSTGCFNTATGVSALRANTTGVGNTASGFNALPVNTTGNNNTASGSNALCINTAGDDNTAMGAFALRCSTGSNNIGIGYLAGVSIGNITTESNRIVIGNNDHVCAQIKIAFTATSDCRDKMCFAPIPVGLDFVRALKPTEYQFKQGGRDSTATDGKRRYGFLAQEMLPLEGADPVIISADDPDKLQYTEAHLIPVLVKAIQELTARLEQLENA